MTTGSKLILYVLVGGPVVVALFFLLLAGPFGWFVAAFLVLAGMALRSLLGSDGDDAVPDRTYCSGCGAPNDTERRRCKHCEEPL
jgi:hypothetical protein